MGGDLTSKKTISYFWWSLAGGHHQPKKQWPFEAANGVTAATNGVTAATSKKCGFKNLTLQIQLVAFNTGKSWIFQFQMQPAGCTCNQLVAFEIERSNFFTKATKKSSDGATCVIS